MLCSRTSLTKTSSGSGLCQGTLTGNGYNQKENPEEQKRRNKDLIGKVRVFSISLKLFLHDGDAGSYLNILIYRDFSCSHTLLVRNYCFAIFFLFFCFVLFFVDGITKKKKNQVRYLKLWLKISQHFKHSISKSKFWNSNLKFLHCFPPVEEPGFHICFAYLLAKLQ